MAPVRLTNRQAFIVAMVPAVVLLGGLVATAAIGLVPALGLAALVAAGGWWFLKYSKPGPPPGTETATPSVAAAPQAILDHIPDPVILLNGARTVVATNRAARDLLGIGPPGRDLALSLRHPAVLAAVDTVMSGPPAIRDEINLPLPLARTFTMDVGRLPATGDPDAPAVAVVLHDETRARRAEQSRADFVANASHELRSPLSALIGFIETLQGPARSDAAARERFLEIMRTEARRMARLIEDLLSLSRVEINEHVPPRGRVDVAAVLEERAAALTLRADEKNMRIDVDCTPQPPKVIGDVDQLTQVFHNLVGNAVQYGRPGTSIRLTARAVEPLPGTSARAVAVSVADQGDGITAVHLPRITERFYRVDEGRSRQMGGTGLGLAIVKHIVNRHRGQLKIESKEGVGSIFTVVLPAADADRGECSAASAPTLDRPS